MSRGVYDRKVRRLKCFCGNSFKGKKAGSLCPLCRIRNKTKSNRVYNNKNSIIVLGSGVGRYDRKYHTAVCIVCKRDFRTVLFKANRACPSCIRRVADMRKKHKLRHGIGSSLSVADVVRVMDRDGMICTYCSASLIWNMWCIDHIIPVSRGGDNEFDNLCMSCIDCNRQKSSKTGVEYLKWRDDKTQGDCTVSEQIGRIEKKSKKEKTRKK